MANCMSFILSIWLCSEIFISKQPSQSAKQKALQKLTLSYFNNVVHLIPQLTDPETLRLALTESAKILPYVVSSRKAVKTYLKASPNLLCSYLKSLLQRYLPSVFAFPFFRSSLNEADSNTEMSRIVVHR